MTKRVSYLGGGTVIRSGDNPYWQENTRPARVPDRSKAAPTPFFAPSSDEEYWKSNPYDCNIRVLLSLEPAYLQQSFEQVMTVARSLVCGSDCSESNHYLLEVNLLLQNGWFTRRREKIELVLGAGLINLDPLAMQRFYRGMLQGMDQSYGEAMPVLDRGYQEYLSRGMA